MSQIYYSLVTVPAWNTPVVSVHFFATTLVLGALAAGCALMLTAAVRRRWEGAAGRGAQGTRGDVAPARPAARGGGVATMVRARVETINAPTSGTQWALTTPTGQ